MANTRSAEKNIRKTKKRTALNRQKKDAIRGARKKLQTAVTAGNVKQTSEELSLYVKALDKAAKRNTIHPNKASRLKSRAAARLKKIALGGAAAPVAAKKKAAKKASKKAAKSSK